MLYSFPAGMCGRVTPIDHPWSDLPIGADHRYLPACAERILTLTYFSLHCSVQTSFMRTFISICSRTTLSRDCTICTAGHPLRLAALGGR